MYQTKHTPLIYLVPKLNNAYAKLCMFFGHPVAYMLKREASERGGLFETSNFRRVNRRRGKRDRGLNKASSVHSLFL